MNTEHVLVVDDDPGVLAVVVEMLASIGYKTTAASGARSAVGLLPQIKPDIIITDIVMPDGEGMELILHLTRCKEKPSVIAMSGNPTGVLFLHATELLGVNAVLRKPFSRTELEEALAVASAGAA
ncbi:MAG: response regulator [Spirochaetaceae bacterium]|nr:response regulator [Spirochaetaceae bacterium]